MRKDSELVLKKILEYKEEIKKDSFELNIQYFQEIPNIESVIYDIIDDLITNKCITSNSRVIDGAENVKIELTMDGLSYFDSPKKKHI